MFQRGYKAREKAGVERSKRRLVSEEVRAQRAALLEANIASLTNTEVDAELAAQAPVPGASDETFDDKPSDKGLTKLNDIVPAEEADGDEEDGTEGDETKPRRGARKTK